MRKLTPATLIILIAIILLGQACQSAREYQISGMISGAEDGMLIYLRLPDQAAAIDSTTIESERFSFHGKLENPALVHIIIMKNPPSDNSRQRTWQPVIPLFLENSKIELTAPLDEIPDQMKLMNRQYSYDAIFISGSKLHQLYTEFFRNKQELDNQRSQMFMSEYISYLNPGPGKVKGPISEGVQIVSRLDEIEAERKIMVLDFIMANTSNFVGLHVAHNELGLFNAAEIDQVLDEILPSLKKTKQGEEFVLKAKEVKKTAIGSRFADFDLFDTDGNAAKLSDYLGKGDYVLLNFWASWCGPCIADLPHKKEAFELYKSEGFKIVSISMDSDKEAWLKKIEEYQIPWVQLSDLQAFEGDLSKLYNFNGIPTNLLITPEGKIASRNMRGSWMDKLLIEHFGNKY